MLVLMRPAAAKGTASSSIHTTNMRETTHVQSTTEQPALVLRIKTKTLWQHKSEFCVMYNWCLAAYIH